MFDENLEEWDCPICLENIDSGIDFIVSPFNCQHKICITCCKKSCKYLHQNNKNIINNFKCPLCKSNISEYYKNNKRLVGKKCTINGFTVSIM